MSSSSSSLIAASVLTVNPSSPIFSTVWYLTPYAWNISSSSPLPGGAASTWAASSDAAASISLFGCPILRSQHLNGFAAAENSSAGSIFLFF